MKNIQAIEQLLYIISYTSSQSKIDTSKNVDNMTT